MSKLGDELEEVYLEQQTVVEHLQSIASGVQGAEARFFRVEVQDIARWAERVQDRVLEAKDWLSREKVQWKSSD